MIGRVERNRKSVSEIIRNAFLCKNVVLQGCRKTPADFFHIRKIPTQSFYIGKMPIYSFYIRKETVCKKATNRFFRGVYHDWGRRSCGVMGRRTRQGVPTATTLGGMSLLTRLPAPMTEFRPIVTPGSTIQFAPSQTFSSICMGRLYCICSRRCSGSIGCVAVQSTTLGPIMTWSAT